MGYLQWDNPFLKSILASPMCSPQLYPFLHSNVYDSTGRLFVIYSVDNGPGLDHSCNVSRVSRALFLYSTCWNSWFNVYTILPLLYIQIAWERDITEGNDAALHLNDAILRQSFSTCIIPYDLHYSGCTHIHRYEECYLIWQSHFKSCYLMYLANSRLLWERHVSTVV